MGPCLACGKLFISMHGSQSKLQTKTVAYIIGSSDKLIRATKSKESAQCH